MTLRRDQILELVRGLPEQVDVDDLIYRLYLRRKLAAAEEDVRAGRVVSAEEVRKRVAGWRR